jgi:hypothetical protein
VRLQLDMTPAKPFPCPRAIELGVSEGAGAFFSNAIPSTIVVFLAIADVFVNGILL